MRKMSFAVVALLLAGTAPCLAAPVGGTCRVSQLATIIGNLGFTFPLAGAAGFEFPVEVDAAAGTFAIDPTSWTELEFITVGIPAFLDMQPGIVRGSIDGAGQVTLPAFGVVFTTHFCDPPCVLPFSPPLTTGLQGTELSGSMYVTRGEPLDFATGRLALAGQVADPSTPGSPSTPGVSFTCVLSPIPVQAELPRGPSLEKVAGKARVDASFTAGDQGDVLALKAKLAPGAAPLELDGNQNFFLRLGVPERDIVLLVVRAGRFQTKGKKLVASRNDACNTRTGQCNEDRTLSCESADDCDAGKPLEVLVGRKETADIASVLSGSLVLSSGKTGGKLGLVLRGLDLGGLGDRATLTVTTGGQNPTRELAVTGSGKTRKLR